MSRRDRRVRGKDRLLRDVARRRFKGHAGLDHLLTHRFQGRERIVPLVEVVDAGRNTERRQSANAADPAEQFLKNTTLLVAAVQRAR